MLLAYKDMMDRLACIGRDRSALVANDTYQYGNSGHHSLLLPGPACATYIQRLDGQTGKDQYE